MKFIKKHFVTIMLTLIILIGFSLMLYPIVSDWWNSSHQTQAIASYSEMVEQLDDVDYKQLWNDAQEYNQRLREKSNRWVLSEEELEEYEHLLNIDDNGIMGYIKIPSLKVSLPVYHSVNDSVLQVAVGHIEGSSLPVGGESTHCVLSGHRGLPSAKLFSDLDEMKEGDLFTLHVLNETLTYEVDKIRVVLPEEMSSLEIEEGKDLCTLVTCTPYGINTHRILVQGHRVENVKGEVNVVAEAIRVNPIFVATIVAIPILLILVISVFVDTGKKKKR